MKDDSLGLTRAGSIVLPDDDCSGCVDDINDD